MGIKGFRNLGQSTDLTFSWITELNPDLEQWRSLVEEWLKNKRNKHQAVLVMSKFFRNYMYQKNVSATPDVFLRRDYPIKPYYNAIFGKMNTLKVNGEINLLHDFINWVLKSCFSVEDDNGYKIIPHEYHNPISLDLPDGINLKGMADESNKNPLPFRFIKQLRHIVCPNNAIDFQDWKWAQEVTDADRGGDWFIVDPSIIDENDSDCVWRKRKTSNHNQKKNGLPEVVYELWSPVRIMIIYIKLLLPLRTYQVRMLDSGEADTYRYEQPERNLAGKWIPNPNSLRGGSEKYPVRRGVFRRFINPLTKTEMTGFYINTNKTADIGKDEWSKGYEVPWQYEEALYWMSKLRDWQEKYNPIEEPTPWTDLERKQLGSLKDQTVLKQMGASCFLFRNPVEEENKTKPITKSIVDNLWYKPLLELQIQCRKLTDIQGEKNLIFVKENCRTTNYPLHSLRVSLITAYALEGGVPMPILSKCIAGHSRLLMTLYYTKAGITYVTDKMAEAEKRLAEQEQSSYLKWVKDATYKQLEAYTAINDPASLQAVLNAQQSGADFIRGDKGICPKGSLGCETGGVYVNNDTGATNYGVVPGYPEQNCVRCRWFLTGPAFLFGLVYHFNVLGYNMSETADRAIHFEQEIEELENLRFTCEQSNFPFLENEKLSQLERLHQQEMIKNDKVANDYNATLRLIDRCIAIAKQQQPSAELQFVAVGTMEDVKVAIEEVPNKFYQIQTVCNGATFFPETDARTAVLQRSQILDLTLAFNEQKPVFFRLTEEQQLVAGNALMQLLIKHNGSLEGAVPYVEGRKRLTDITGLENEVVEFIKGVTGKRLQLPSERNPNALRMIKNSSDKEVSNVY